MSDLVTLDTVKAYLRIENTVQDELLDVLIESAEAEIVAYLRRPIWNRAITVTDHGDTVRAYGVRTTLQIPVTPVASGSVVIADAEAATVDDTTYTVDLETGIVRASEGYTFPSPPYALTADVGLEHRDDFELACLPVLRGAMLDILADAHQRRNPTAQAEGSGGGVYTQWQAIGIPERTARKLDAFRRVGVV
jgi:hypothetical protein